jgi:SAM-dependent methyltransferase
MANPLLRAIPKRLRDMSRTWRMYRRADAFARNIPDVATSDPVPASSAPDRDFYGAVEDGPGIWKWEHYPEIYRRHFERFRGRDVHVVEVGIFGGGSLALWTRYFGPGCRIYGVDIDPACAVHEGGNVRVFIGDQADRDFWRRFKQAVPRVDILIDDGGHDPEQQIATFEEMLPHLSPGGVFLCEDVHGVFNGFALYANGLMQALNAALWRKTPPGPGEPELLCRTTGLQDMIQSVHAYPFVTVFEKQSHPRSQFAAPKLGRWRGRT